MKSERHQRALARVRARGEVCWAEVDLQTGALSRSTGIDPVRAPGPRNDELVPPFEYLTPFFGRNLVGLAYNYRGMMGTRDQYDEPLVFLKGAHAAIAAAGAPAGCGRVELPRWADCVWVEAELAIVVSQPCFEVSATEARACVMGFCVASDITARNILDRDHHLARSKALSGFAPLSPLVMCNFDPRGRRIETRIDGELFQSSNTDDMILDPWESLSLASQVVPLVRGDVVLTGTPAGALESVVQVGSRVEHSIEGIGSLEFSLVERPMRSASRSWQPRPTARI